MQNWNIIIIIIIIIIKRFMYWFFFTCLFLLQQVFSPALEKPVAFGAWTELCVTWGRELIKTRRTGAIWISYLSAKLAVTFKGVIFTNIKHIWTVENFLRVIVKIYYKNSFHSPNDTHWEEPKRKKYSMCLARGTTLRVGIMHFLRQTALICVNNINRPVKWRGTVFSLM
jgi:hypothetical protein